MRATRAQLTSLVEVSRLRPQSRGERERERGGLEEGSHELVADELGGAARLGDGRGRGLWVKWGEASEADEN